METKQMCFNLNIFDTWLRQEIERQGITVAKLSKKSGVHPNTVRNYLANRCDPSLCNILCIANALGYEVMVVKK